MTPADLLVHLRGISFVLSARDGQVVIRGKTALLTPDLREQVAAVKADLLWLLEAETGGSMGIPTEEPPSTLWRSELWKVPEAVPTPEDVEYAGLVAWFLESRQAGTLPMLGPIVLGQGWTLLDPVKAYAYYRERIELGQLPRETSSFLRRLKLLMEELQ